jgi:cytochrome b subunit of formate dehydrogenase
MIPWLVIATIFLQPRAAAEETPNQSCSECHAPSNTSTSPTVLRDLLAGSVHAGLDCTDCHQSISIANLNKDASNPHGEAVEPVRCGECHDEPADAYEMHGRLSVGADPDMPKCWSCHGSHDVRSTKDPLSRVYPKNLPKTCESCHTNVDVTREHEILENEPIKLYESSVHGQKTAVGESEAATCIDCHAAESNRGERTGHRIGSPSDPKSPTFRSSVPATCGRCHADIAEAYWQGIHGQRVRRGDTAAPICTDCHGEHGIRRTSDLKSPVSAARLAVATCTRCHESELLRERYGVTAGAVKSFIDTFHGLKRQAGDVLVANCASCHGSHLILPHTDPQSSIAPGNLQKTCGACHPGISAVMASGSIHAPDGGRGTGWPRFFTVLYIWIICITIGLMLLHNFAHWFRHVRLRRLKGYVRRFNANETVQHWILMISFTVLVISGFSLRFSESWWVELLFGWGGGAGFLIRGLVHRIAAVVMMLSSAWHVAYLFTGRGRRWVNDIAPSWNDVTHINRNVSFFLGRGEEPRFGRFSYMEKLEYWAMVWGTVLMTLTGLVLWFDNFFAEKLQLPRVVLDVVQVIHYYEAWLATLAILVWHLYGTVFSPTVYPMNTAWWAGRMAQDTYAHEHPEGPPLSVTLPTQGAAARKDAPSETGIPSAESPPPGESGDHPPENPQAPRA